MSDPIKVVRREPEQFTATDSRGWVDGFRLPDGSFRVMNGYLDWLIRSDEDGEFVMNDVEFRAQFVPVAQAEAEAWSAVIDTLMGMAKQDQHHWAQEGDDYLSDLCGQHAEWVELQKKEVPQ